MKRVQLLNVICICLSGIIAGDQLPGGREEQVQEMAKEGYKKIDAIFEHARASVIAKEDLMDAQWFAKQKEIKELQNLLSDSAIIFSFDKNEENPIPKMLSTYVEYKINEEVPYIFGIYGISVKRVEDFYQFSHTMCKLSGGSWCGRMIRAIESDNFDKMLKLKLQKMAREQLRKEASDQLRDVFLFGGNR